MTDAGINVLSITPTKSSDVLKHNVFDSFEVAFSVQTGADEAIIITKTFDPEMIFSFEQEEDACAWAGADLIQRFRSVAGL